jgi:hypothetical protein
MEHEGSEVNKEQYVGAKYVREHLMVSRTTAYEIMREIEEVYAPSADFRHGRSLRVRKDVFLRWVSEHCGEAHDPCVNAFITQLWAAPRLRRVS